MPTDRDYQTRMGRELDAYEAEQLAELECLDDHGEGTCEGPVEYRMAMSGTGRSFPRCEKHFAERLETQRGIQERYPALPPSDFDPAYAGESWDEQ